MKMNVKNTEQQIWKNPDINLKIIHSGKNLNVVVKICSWLKNFQTSLFFTHLSFVLQTFNHNLKQRKVKHKLVWKIFKHGNF